jgi:hypothetical protein
MKNVTVFQFATKSTYFINLCNVIPKDHSKNTYATGALQKQYLK